MECQKITNLLGNISDKLPKFITKKWIEIHYQSGNSDNRCKPGKEIIFKTPYKLNNKDLKHQTDNIL